MRFSVNGRNITITPSLKEYVEEKIGKVVKHYDQIMDMVVTLGVTKNPSVAKNHSAEVSCLVNGAKIHVHEEAETMYAAIDLLADKLDRQVKKHKDKIIRGKSGSYSIRNSSIQQIPEEEISETPESTDVD